MRLGNPKRIDPAVRKYSLDELVEDKIRAAADDYARAQAMLADNTNAIIALDNQLHDGDDGLGSLGAGVGHLAAARASHKRVKAERPALLAAVASTKVSAFLMYLWFLKFVVFTKPFFCISKQGIILGSNIL